MMRLKNVKTLDPYKATLIENAYYMCKVRCHPKSCSGRMCRPSVVFTSFIYCANPFFCPPPHPPSFPHLHAHRYTQPSERSARVQRKERPPLQEYMRHLVFSELNKHTTETVLRQLRKLPWDSACEVCVLCCLLSVYMCVLRIVVGCIWCAVCCMNAEGAVCSHMSRSTC